MTSQLAFRFLFFDMQRWQFSLAKKSRQDKKYPLTRQQASARFVTGKQPKKIKYIRPQSYQAKPSSRYYPKRGSSEGKIKTQIIGAKRLDNM